LLVTMSLVIHTCGLGLIGLCLMRWFGRAIDAAHRGHDFMILFPVVVGIATFLLALLHGLEASLWAIVFVWLGASPDFTHAVYFSLQMVTTLGADVVTLEPRWRLMGPLEAVGGMLLFGLSTAFLFAVLQRIWPSPSDTKGKRQGSDVAQ
jgi:hypothetical protein